MIDHRCISALHWIKNYHETSVQVTRDGPSQKIVMYKFGYQFLVFFVHLLFRRLI